MTTFPYSGIYRYSHQEYCMITNLYIRDFALIESLEIPFQNGMTVLTGESGSGKSLVLDALSSLFGSKCGTGNIRTGKEKYFLQAMLSIPKDSPAFFYLVEQGFRVEADEVLISKELYRDGKSRVKIGDSLASLTHLRELGKRIAEIHTQNEQLILLEKNHQLEYLDKFGNLEGLKSDCKTAFRSYQLWKEKANQSFLAEKELEQKKQNLEFQILEIEKLSPKEGEEEALIEEEKFLTSGEKLADLYRSILEETCDKDDSLLRRFSFLESLLQKIVVIQPDKQVLIDSLQDMKELLVSIKDDIRDEEEELFFSPERLDMVQARLQELQKAKKKLGLSIPEMLQSIQELKSDLEKCEEKVGNKDQILLKKKESLDHLKSIAFQLSKTRRNCIQAFEDEMQKEMSDLGLEGSRLQVVLRWEESPDGDVEEGSKLFYMGESGLDQIEFYFTANLGEKPRPLRKVASGGELSRVMLALRSLLGKHSPAPKILVLDEIDTGLGGETGVTLGKKLKKLSRSSQILLVTHTQQVASQGDHHFRVEKALEGGRTQTMGRFLEEEERKKELARMIGGKRYSENAFLAASDLLNRKAV